MVTWIFAATWPPTPTTLTTRLVPIWHTIKTMSVLFLAQLYGSKKLPKALCCTSRQGYLSSFVQMSYRNIVTNDFVKHENEMKFRSSKWIHRFWIIHEETRDRNIYEEQQDMCPVWQTRGWGKAETATTTTLRQSKGMPFEVFRVRYLKPISPMRQ